MPRKQCKKCPWRVDVDPNDIPNGYCSTKHAGLRETIAEPARVADLAAGGIRIMACHETAQGAELPCVGWLHHQLGVGNNLMLRMMVIHGKINADYELVGEQHETFEDTLPVDAKETDVHKQRTPPNGPDASS